eukprot:1156142-Pelagomonas_calceolata.AAC.2
MLNSKLPKQSSNQKLVLKLHTHSVQLTHEIASTRCDLEKTFPSLVDKIRHRALLVTHLIPVDFFLHLVEMIHSVQP